MALVRYSGEQWLQLLAVMRATGADLADFEAVAAEALRRIQPASEQDLARWEELVRAVIYWINGRRPAAERDRLNATAAACQANPVFQQKVRDMTQTIAEAYIEEGVAKGLAEGEVRAYRDMLKEWLTQRFGPLPEELSRRIDALSDPARLRAANSQVLKLKSLDELAL